ncbi:unnamed protein product [Calypogeia fissa]
MEPSSSKGWKRNSRRQIVPIMTVAEEAQIQRAPSRPSRRPPSTFGIATQGPAMEAVDTEPEKTITLIADRNYWMGELEERKKLVEELRVSFSTLETLEQEIKAIRSSPSSPTSQGILQHLGVLMETKPQYDMFLKEKTERLQQHLEHRLAMEADAAGPDPSKFREAVPTMDQESLQFGPESLGIPMETHEQTQQEGTVGTESLGVPMETHDQTQQEGTVMLTVDLKGFMKDLKARIKGAEQLQIFLEDQEENSKDPVQAVGEEFVGEELVGVVLGASSSTPRSRMPDILQNLRVLETENMARHKLVVKEVLQMLNEQLSYCVKIEESQHGEVDVSDTRKMIQLLPRKSQVDLFVQHVAAIKEIVASYTFSHQVLKL